MGRGTTRISRRPVHVSVLEPILPGDLPDTRERPAAMTELWRARIDAALRDR